MTQTVAFHTRARTIDHLGREQIADCPTAISELWKNAYDAYARSVELHIFDSAPACASIVDNGHGMNSEEFVSRWLVVGTETKLARGHVVEEDRLGLSERESQGEKGIGRLSIAALGPITVIISKRKNSPFVCAMIDWRIFQNPYLVLNDIEIPVDDFDSKEQLRELIPAMLSSLKENIHPSRGTPERIERVNVAWKTFDALEIEQKKQETSAQILSGLNSITLTDEILNSWHVWNESSETGTALFVFQLNRELAVWVNSSLAENTRQDSEINTIKGLLKKTLVGFVDPYTDFDIEFDYKVLIHSKGEIAEPIAKGQHPDLQNLHELEHYIEGEFDPSGLFTGSIHAFGKTIGTNIKIPPSPSVPIPRKPNELIGPFRFCVGTFEQEPVNSTHPPDQVQKLLQQAHEYAGIAVYRDHLRVMPYGRPESDFFELEERRSRHAGREFWAHRRCFGCVAFKRSTNPNLRDKAGREGLIDNRAKRVLRILVMDLLKLTARRYFGTGSDVRETVLPEIKAQNAAIEEASSKVKQRRFTAFRTALRANNPKLLDAQSLSQKVAQEIESARSNASQDTIQKIADAIEFLTSKKTELRLPPKPPSLRELESDYRGYRDRFHEYCATVETLNKKLSILTQNLMEVDVEQAAQSALLRHQKFLNDEISRRVRDIDQMLVAENNRVREQANSDRSNYYSMAAPLLEELRLGRMQLALTLNELESIRESLWQKTIPYYDSYIRAIQQISEKIDLDALAIWNSDQKAELEKRVWQLHELAQLGITVEIVGHELYTLDAEVGRNMKRMPVSVKESDAYRLALSAHESLVHRLRFLEPLALSGPRLREVISGERILNYIRGFFGNRFEQSRVLLTATTEFRSLRISELPSRIFPVFVNLINNALYWVSLTENRQREIVLATVNDYVVIADSGRGVDPDDESHLFELFFSRRVNGRGIGLYLAKTTLEAGGHTIAYLTEQETKVLPGANFGIRFKGGLRE
jgi:signal transduction histidine kinase